MSHLRLFEHPANRKLFGVGVPKLYITGTLPNAKPSLAYEGRLSIVNAGGDCTAWLVSGELPPGSQVYADNATDEIIVAWPAYEAAAVAIPNAGLESGSDGWLFGPGWSVTTDNPVSGVNILQYVNHGGDSIALNVARAAIAPGTAITAGCVVRQGASSKGNAGACVRLEFFDAAGTTIANPEGNMISQGSNNEAQASTVAAVAPADAATVGIATRGFRKRQNRTVWVDDFHWNLAQPSVGTDADGQWCITLRVRDALGREADWSGCIVVRNGFWVFVANLTYLTVNTDLTEYSAVKALGATAHGRVDFGAGLVVACGVNEPTYVYSADDGETVTAAGTGLSPSAGGGDTYFGAGYWWQCCGVNLIGRSATGLPGTWATPTASTLSRSNAMAFLGNRIISASIYNDQSTYSDNGGVSWAKSSNAAVFTASTLNGLMCMDEADGVVCLLNHGGYPSYITAISWTDDGYVWHDTGYRFASAGSTGTSGGGAITGRPGLWVAVDGSGEIAYSVDGKVWLMSPFSVPALGPGNYSLANDGAAIVLCTTSGIVKRTTNGIDWTDVTDHPFFGTPIWAVGYGLPS